MRCTFEVQRTNAAAQRVRLVQIVLVAQCLQLRADITFELVQVAQQQPVERAAEPVAGRAAGLHDAQLRLLQHQQQAMRLDRTGELDQLAIAIRHVGLAKGWADRHEGAQT